MAAYAALASLMNTIDQIKLHPRPPISLDETQVESLTTKVTFLQEFLGDYNFHVGYTNEADGLEMRIADAAYAAEDVIESCIVDRVLASHDGEKMMMSSNIDDEFCQSLQKVIEDMEMLKAEVKEIREKTGVRAQLLRSSTAAGSSGSSSTGQNLTMVGFDNVLVELMDKLIGGQPDRQIIPIVGMGGIGKTTLAENVYRNPVIVQHFDILVLVTVSQEYSVREILVELLQEGRGDLNHVNEHELGLKLHKRLSGRRYLIIIDDIWDIEVWNQLNLFFPGNQNGSRILITTRILNFQFSASYVVKMGFLDEDKSWDLFSKIVFGEEGCPIELEEIGKAIVKNCRGLPLSIVVVGGFIAKFEHTLEYWEAIAENLSAIVNLEDDERCLKTLHMSYNQLPVHLKPCFLYMGVFSEDRKIRVSDLTKLWVAEGIVRPISGKSLEEVGDEYLEELINRNLVLVHELGCIRNVKYCKIHDLLRDLCLRQAEKERFYNVMSPRSLNAPSTQRRLVIPERASQNEVRSSLSIMSHARSLISDSREVPPLRKFRLLRIVSCPEYVQQDFQKDMFKIVNARCLIFKACYGSLFPSSFDPLWNLQTLIVRTGGNSARFKIWSMPQLRHLKFVEDFYLPDLPSEDCTVLKNLQTLTGVRNLNCCEEVVKRIPNIKKIKVYYTQRINEDVFRDYHVNNFNQLHKLESFECSQNPASSFDYLEDLTFPHSLKKLTLSGNMYWEDTLEKVGSLPLLEKLKLKGGYFEGGEWETVEEQFCSLKILKIKYCRNLTYWTTESSHFPRLEHLALKGLVRLDEIPPEIGEIPTLKSIKLDQCTDHAIISAKKIVEEQEELSGEVDFQVHVWTSDPDQQEQLQSLTSPNFQIFSRMGYRRLI